MLKNLKYHCRYDQLLDPTELKAHPRNRNSHPSEQIERLAKILEYQGWRYPVNVSKRSGFIVTGHGRVQAAIKLGCTVPVVFQDFDSDEQEYAAVQSDNAIASWSELDLAKINLDLAELGPDFDIDLLGIEGFEIDVADKYADKDEDEVPEVKESICKLGDVWRLGSHRLMCGDATSITDVEKLMNSEMVDMVFTDPPYNINYIPEDRAIGGRARSENKLGGIENDNMNDEEFYEFLVKVMTSIRHVAVAGCAIYQIAPTGLNNLQYLRAWDDLTLHYSDGLVWLKNNHSISRKDYHPKHEIIHYGWVTGAHDWFGGRDKFSVIEFSRDKVTEYVHPTQKPVDLVKFFLLNSSEDNSNVLDLFGGSGTTLIACEKTGRKAFLMELDPHYCDVIIQRWQNFTGKVAERLNET